MSQIERVEILIHCSRPDAHACDWSWISFACATCGRHVCGWCHGSPDSDACKRCRAAVAEQSHGRAMAEPHGGRRGGTEPRCHLPDEHARTWRVMAFICDRCGGYVCGTCFGADDALPDACDDCWCAAELPKT